MPKNNTPIELRNEGTYEIISQVPSWATKWGSTAMASVILLLFSVSFAIKYPDIIKGRVQISTKKIPVQSIAKKSGRVIHLNVKQGEIVNRGDVLAVLESETNYEDFLLLESELKEITESFSFNHVTNMYIDKSLQLGSISVAFSSFYKAYENYTQYINSDITLKELSHLNTELKSLKNIKNQTEVEYNILKKKMKVTQKQLDRGKMLRDDKVYSEVDFEDMKKIYLQEKYNVESLKTQVLGYDVKISQVKSKIAALEKQDWLQKRELLLQLKTTVLYLKSKLQNWREEHVIEAKVKGKVSLDKVWAVNQFTREGENILTIQPTEKSLVGQVLTDSKNIGKAKRGQIAYICLDAFNCSEYGKIKGIVQSISNTKNNGFYRIEIAIETPLKTLNDKEIKSESFTLEGSASIETDKISLIERVFNRIKYLWKGSF